MSIWFSKQLGDGIMASTPLGEIAEAFGPVFEAADKPVEMAVFTRSDTEGHLHCEVIAFFSPAAEEVARRFAAEPCARPRQDGPGAPRKPRFSQAT